MKIGILGAGAMGILFGGSLKKAGYDVKLIMRDRSKRELINKEGIKINLDNERHTGNNSLNQTRGNHAKKTKALFVGSKEVRRIAGRA